MPRVELLEEMWEQWEGHKPTWSSEEMSLEMSIKRVKVETYE